MFRLFTLFFLLSCTPDPQPDQPLKPVILGSESAWKNQLFSGNNYVLLTNIPSQKQFSLADSLIIKGKLKRIFSPEHGFESNQADGVILNSEPVYQGIPVVSLYGKKKSPEPHDFSGTDTLLIDIQDVGLRFYTYLSTVLNCLTIAANEGIPVVILDRPNPMGGLIVEGPVLADSLKSFVGPLPIPIRYGLTLGELMTMAFSEGWVTTTQPLQLKVIKVDGWKRDFLWPETGLAWVPTSPNIPTFSALFMYSGTCLFEGTAISEGRGTPTPFEWIGFPWANESHLKSLKEFGLRGELIQRMPEDITGKSVNTKFKGKVIAGIQITAADQKNASPLKWAVSFLKSQKNEHPNEIGIRRHLWLLWGQPNLDLAKEVEEKTKQFEEKRKIYFLYQ
ncbi:MAG: DUF1343 domain-containing protein [Bacteroidetes bacterium]|nr:DUF1343 domain-containing protein [Bacteroidota bacterium]